MKESKILPLCIAELVGTFFLVFFGCGSVLVAKAFPGEYGGLFIPLGFGGTVSIMIYATGHLSGAHFNPAVTLAFFSVKKFPAARILPYIFAQTLGALLASYAHSLIFADPFNFAMTSTSLPLGAAFLVEFLLSFVLMFVIISVATDSRAVGELAGIAIGSTVSLCAMFGGPLTGASMNPARSFAPALFAGNFENFWLYIVPIILGTVCAAHLYEWIKCSKEIKENDPDCC